MKKSIAKNLKSYTYASKGILHVLLFENNFKYQVTLAILAITISYLLEVNTIEWIIIIALISLVLAAEMFNAAIEKLCDHLHPEEHPAIGLVKDISAGGVLILALSSAIIGAIIFLPKLLLLL